MTENEALEKHKDDCKRCRHKICRMSGRGCECLQETDIKAYEQLLKYRSIGTVDEFHDAMEKQKAKRPLEYEAHEEYDDGICPNCGEFVNSVFNNCMDCGQKLDWSDA